MGEYLNYQRILMAKELLLKQEISLAEISSKIGYNEMRAFANQFRKFEGITPKEYRKNALNAGLNT